MSPFEHHVGTCCEGRHDNEAICADGVLIVLLAAERDDALAQLAARDEQLKRTGPGAGGK